LMFTEMEGMKNIGNDNNCKRDTFHIPVDAF
jgi:hypothetical protein